MTGALVIMSSCFIGIRALEPLLLIMMIHPLIFTWLKTAPCCGHTMTVVRINHNSKVVVGTVSWNSLYCKELQIQLIILWRFITTRDSLHHIAIWYTVIRKNIDGTALSKKKKKEDLSGILYLLSNHHHLHVDSVIYYFFLHPSMR